MKIVIIDDEYLARQIIESYAVKLPFLEVVASIQNPLELIPLMQKHSIDLIFLDIQMPEISGISLVKSLTNLPLFVFTTAYSEFAVEAFEINSFDYLLKPFSFDRFEKTINKAKNHFEKEESSTVNQLTVKVDRDFINLPFEDIVYIESDREYVRIFTKKSKYMYLDTMKRLETILPSSMFARVHKSYIINMKMVSSLKGNTLTVQEHEIPLSRSKKTEVKKLLFDK